MELSHFFKELDSSKEGLSIEEAQKRIEKYGYNELEEKKDLTPLKIITRQITGNFLVLVLIGAAIVSFFASEILNFYVITFIVLFIVILGFIQEYRAENALKSLKSMTTQQIIVLRSGKKITMSSKELVPGDVALLEIGDKIPADGKIFDVYNIKIDESSLTGESESAEKKENDDIYSGTFIVSGKCKALIISTGMKTKIGEIAETLKEEDEKTDLQIKTENLAKTLTYIVGLIAVLIFTWGILSGVNPIAILIVAISVAVAGIPEGLPFTMTLSLIIGVQKMAKNNAIVRRMLSVESLGSVNVICTDKTGTLTKNEMSVEKVFVNDKEVDVTGRGYTPKGDFIHNEEKVDLKNKTIEKLFFVSALCNNALLEEKKGVYKVAGDPTEGALLVLAAKAGIWKEEAEKKHNRIEEVIFTSERKMMSTIHNHSEGIAVFSKGAPEVLLSKCYFIEKDGKIERLTREEHKSLLEINKKFASSALRVLSVAYKIHKKSSNYEDELVFLGLIAMKDPPREEVKDAIKLCKDACIRTVMITGDNEHTARSIAKEIGIDDGEIITGKQLDEMSDKELEFHSNKVSIFARTYPEHKMRIVNALKKKGNVVAMTGDGVNDAPAIKKSNVGIAMGMRGTDVTKDSADIILSDDNFSTIVKAIESGRSIYENIQKIIYYLLSTTFSEVMLISLGLVIFGFDRMPLIALQILLVNMVTEEMPAIALGVDPARKDIMNGVSKRTDFITKKNMALMASLALFTSIITLIIFSLYLPNIDKARTMALVTLISFVAFNSLNFKSLDKSLLSTNLLSNKWLLLALAGTALCTLAVVYIPFLQVLFKTVPLEISDLLIALIAASTVFVFMEIKKRVIK